MIDDRAALVAECIEDPVFFCEEFLPHLFPTPLKWFHRGILALLTRQTAFLPQYGEVDKIVKNFVGDHGPLFVVVDGELRLNFTGRLLVMLPRGAGKTTLIGIAYPLYAICLQSVNFLAYVSEAGFHAEMQLSNVKRELETNQRLVAVFGALAPSHNSPLKWTSSLAETANGAALVARGRGGQIRGLNHRGHRPNCILVDDVEDKESVSTEEQRRKTRVWAYGDLLPALDDLDPEAMVLALGTMLHEDALLARWARSQQWTSVVFGAEDADGEPIWAEKFSKEKMQAKREEFAEQGLLYEFYLEYYNKATVADLQVFKPHYIRRAIHPEGLLTAIAIDPALSGHKRASEAVITVAGMEKGGKIWVLDEWAKRGNEVGELVEAYFDLAKRWSCLRCGIESISFQAALVHLVSEAMFRQGFYFDPIKITHTQAKGARIKAILQPRYAGGYIIHARAFPALEAQLMDFNPDREASYDRIDNLANVVSLLDPWAAHAAGQDPSLDQYTTTPEEDVGGEWRRL